MPASYAKSRLPSRAASQAQATPTRDPNAKRWIEETFGYSMLVFGKAGWYVYFNGRRSTAAYCTMVQAATVFKMAMIGEVPASNSNSSSDDDLVSNPVASTISTRTTTTPGASS